MLRKIAFILLAAFLLQCQPSSPDKDFNDKFDVFITKAMNKMSAKYGLAIAVVKDDRMVYEGYFGLADPVNNIPVTAGTDFYIASSTKSFTALATLLAVREGRIGLDRTLTESFPEIDFPRELKADSVTVRHLLTHTSGLENDPLVYLTAFTGNHTPEKLHHVLAEFTRVNKKHPFGQFEYTNFGYVVISMILERALHEPWQDVLARTVFRPLGMKQTSAYISDAARNNWPLARPCTQMNRENRLEPIDLQKQDNTMHAAGGMITTAGDLSRFLIAELNGGRVDGEQIFPADLIHESQKPQVIQDRRYFDMHRFAYGYGWNLATVPSGDTLIHHYGGFAGAHAQVAFMPQYGTGVAVLTNENGQGQDLAYLVASYAFDYMSGLPGLDSVYTAELDSMVVRNDRWRERIFAHEDERAKRTWQLELPFGAYSGVYLNDPLGELIVTNPADSVLQAELGNLKSAPAEPFTRPNSIRVEMIPGSGSVLQFEVKEERITGALLNGMRFERKE